MSDLKFYCPRCSQKIQCDEQWGGHKIQCPACQGELMVPRLAAAPAPAAAISAGSAAPSLRPAPLSSAPAPVRARVASRPAAPAATATGTRFGAARPMAPAVRRKSARSNAPKIIKISVVALVAVVGGYFGFRYISQLQGDLNVKADEAAKNSDGGQVGHIADLYSVLDATDPNRFAADLSTMPREDAPRAGAAPRPNPDLQLPVLPVAWTMDVQAAKIPEGRANGTISGGHFVVDAATLGRTSTSYALSLRQGMGANPEKEVLIYLRAGPGETLVGKSWNVSQDLNDSRTTPQVIKKWKPDPRYALRQQSYRSGYAMKLEIGQVKDGFVPCKIFLSLPDPEQSVVAGLFSIPVVEASDLDMEF